MIQNPTLSAMSTYDIHATYSGTYLRFKTNDDDGWYTGYVESASDNLNEGPRLVIRKINGDMRYINLEDKQTQVSLAYPTLGNINQKKHSWFISRKATRQWKKGLRPSLLDMRAHSVCVLEILRPYGVRTDDKLIDSLYEPTYTEYFEAVEGVGAGDFISRAVSPYFAICNTAKVDKPVLMYKTNIVGVYNGTDLSIPEDLCHIAPMIRRIMPNGNYSIFVQP